ncbi:MAG: nucleotidyltransferase domain-containing protein [Anaerolineae bacterium]|nr:nucleotidyltransferase domain-containing protein [Anaerolineae bacterium]
MIEDILRTLVRQLQNEQTVAIALTGSYARGEATPYSDIDLHHYVTQETDSLSYFYEGDTPVSVTTLNLDAKHEELRAPERAIWAVEGLWQAKSLYDPTGAFAALQAAAHAFVWDATMQEKADAYASHELVGYGEEALKICTGFARQDDSAINYGTLGLVLGVSGIILTQQGILLRSENEYFRKARQAAAALDAEIEFATASGETAASVRMRGQAALRFYIKTIRHLTDIIQPEHRSVIDKTADIITRTL